jgi:putative endonuclease
MSFTVYIIKSLKDGRNYIGSTSNFQRRFADHNTGKVKSTKNRLPFELIYTEHYETKTEALKREKQIKSYKGGEAMKKLLMNNKENSSALS